MSQVDRRSLTTRIYEFLHLKMAIRDIAVGTHLNANTIAKELGASRTTARKAIELLIQDGLVQVDANRHPVVVSLPVERQHEGEPDFDSANQTEQAYRGIYEKIHRRQLRSGETVNAQQLVEELGVSLMTVRQALEWACRDGLFIRIPRKGWRVITLDAAEMHDIYECRLLLEPLALRAAMRHISQQTIDELLSDCEIAIASDDDMTQYDRDEIDMRFHRALVENANSKTMAEVIQPLLRKRLIFVGEYRGSHNSSTFAKEHREILKAIRAQDESRAVRLLISHLKRAKKTHIADMSNQNNGEMWSDCDNINLAQQK